MLVKLIPAYKPYIWGGDRLVKEYNKKPKILPLAESWELSCHKDGESYVSDTESLTEFLSKHPEYKGSICDRFNMFPMLIKLIDADQDLSIQVHPNDEYSKEHEGQLGKTEMWYIVDCEPGAYINYGFKERITKEEFAKAIEDHTICSKLNKVTVKKGDVYFIPSGTIHSIGKGCLIAEVQQNSNVTYRVYDFARRDANGNLRQLHIEKSLDVTNLREKVYKYNFGEHLSQCKYFTADLLNIDGVHSFICSDISFEHLLVVEGEAIISDENESVRAMQGDSILLTANKGAYSISGKGRIIRSRIEPYMLKVSINMDEAHINVSLSDKYNNILGAASCEAKADKPWAEAVSDMARCVGETIKKAGYTPDDCEYIEVKDSGALNTNTGAKSDSTSGAIECQSNYPLAEKLKELTGIDTHWL